MLKAVQWVDASLRILDQSALPRQVVYCDCHSHHDVAEAIRSMRVRGAPAIGVAAAYGMVLGALNYPDAVSGGIPCGGLAAWMDKVADDLTATRPTAVNLQWAVRRMLCRFSELTRESGGSPDFIRAGLLVEADRILEEDIEMNRSIGRYGNDLIPTCASILTHCNAGALATGGYGTALGVIRTAHESGKQIEVYADETRPLLQGARLTAWELMQDGIPVALVTDNMAGWLMQQGRIDLVLVGADRITANGDVANKIGTYGLAVLAHAHQIPFYVAAPASTVDLSLASGEGIPIEERHPDEVRCLGGDPGAPEGVRVYNPAFDVTPHRLITAMVTDRGVIRPPYDETLTAALGGKPLSA